MPIKPFPFSPVQFQHNLRSMENRKIIHLYNRFGFGLTGKQIKKLSGISFAEKLPAVDLFLVDINIPQRSGYELLADIRAHKTLNTTKVVALTAGTHANEVTKAREAGFDGFISKPLNPNQFANQVQSILNGETIWE